MTDEARIARLTKLAREVYGAETVLHCYCEPEAAWSVRVVGDRIVMLIEGEQAADALEAALLVLADHERVPLTPDAVLTDRLRAAERDRDALRERYAGLVKRLLELAGEWDMNTIEGEGVQWEDAARELREALKP
jgi:hypothetical protein